MNFEISGAFPITAVFGVFFFPHQNKSGNFGAHSKHTDLPRDRHAAPLISSMKAWEACRETYETVNDIFSNKYNLFVDSICPEYLFAFIYLFIYFHLLFPIDIKCSHQPI